MHRLLIAATIACLATPAMAQWTTTGTDMQNANTGYVGVNIAPWQGQFHAYSTNNNAIWGETTLANGSGVGGYNSNTSATGAAVFGWNLGTGGKGVFGYCAATTGSPTGVWGEARSAGGYGVVALNSHASGGIAMYARTYSAVGYSVYSIDGLNYFEGNTGVGTASPSAQLHVSGTVKMDSLSSLTTGTASQLAVDSSGNVLKQAPAFSNGIKEFWTNGSWVIPSGVTRVKFKMWGGGGGGNTPFPAYPGGSGAYIEGTLSVASNGSSNALTIIVGGGGSVGGAGGSTQIKDGATTLLTAGGGGGGTSSTGGGGGTATNSVAGSTFIVKNGTGYTGNFDIPHVPGTSGPNTLITSGSASPRIVSAGTGGLSSYIGAQGVVILEW